MDSSIEKDEKDIVKEVCDMFNIPISDSKKDLSEELEVDKITFDSLIDEISDSYAPLDKKGFKIEKDIEIGGDVTTKENTKSIVEEEELESIVEEEELESMEVGDEKNIEKEDDNLDFDSIVFEIPPEEVKEEVKEVKEEVKEEEYEEEEEEEEEEIRIIDGKIQWILDSPDRVYSKFYKKKKEYIFIYSGGKQLNYEKYTQDLINSKVDVTTEVLDKTFLLSKMDEVQMCIDRVKYIQIKVNDQYFLWKRFTELLRGYLARVQYLKPVAKQEGLVLEHMGDIEFYTTKLEALHDNANLIMKTLERSFDLLSRKVTISMEQRSTDRYVQKDNKKPDNNYYITNEKEDTFNESLEDLDKYDDIQIGSNIKIAKRGGITEWGDI